MQQRSLAQRQNPDGVPRRNPKPEQIDTRRWTMFQLHVNAGWSYRRLSRTHDVSVERVRQLVTETQARYADGVDSPITPLPPAHIPPHWVRAYTSMARVAGETGRDPCTLTDEEILAVRNIGPAILGMIRQICTTDTERIA